MANIWSGPCYHLPPRIRNRSNSARLVRRHLRREHAVSLAQITQMVKQAKRGGTQASKTTKICRQRPIVQVQLSRWFRNDERGKIRRPKFGSETTVLVPVKKNLKGKRRVSNSLQSRIGWNYSPNFVYMYVILLFFSTSMSKRWVQATRTAPSLFFSCAFWYLVTWKFCGNILRHFNFAISWKLR